MDKIIEIVLSGNWMDSFYVGLWISCFFCFYFCMYFLGLVDTWEDRVVAVHNIPWHWPSLFCGDGQSDYNVEQGTCALVFFKRRTLNIQRCSGPEITVQVNCSTYEWGIIDLSGLWPISVTVKRNNVKVLEWSQGMGLVFTENLGSEENMKVILQSKNKSLGTQSGSNL